MKILLVEDDPSLRAWLQEVLQANRYSVEGAAHGAAGLALARATAYDLVVLDVQLPQLDGLALCRQLRSQGYDRPILLLTGNDTDADVVAGFEAGADDYVIKPVAAAVLLARVRTLLRRRGSQSAEGATGSAAALLQWGRLVLDPDAGRVFCGERSLNLTATEYHLLELFLQHPNRIFSRSAILDQLWGFADAPTDRAVVTHVKDLRKKLKAAGLAEELIETIYGMGYRLQPAPVETPPETRRGDRAAAGDAKINVDKNVSTNTNTNADRNVNKNTDGIATVNQGMDKRGSAAPGSVQPQSGAIASTAVNRVLERFRGTFAADLALLLEFNQRLQAGELDPTQQQTARQRAHQLAGSLGSFGYPQGSKLARSLEHLLLADLPWSAANRARYAETVIALQQELDNPPGTATPLPAAPAGVMQGLLVGLDPSLLQSLQAEAAAWGVRLQGPVPLAEVSAALTRFPAQVLLLDLRGLAPEELARWQQEARSPQVPVVVLAERDRLIDRLEATRLGAAQFLPQSASAADILQAIRRAIARSPVAEARVLVVDDDPAMLALLDSLLAPWGLAVTPLADPQQFWETLVATDPDLVLLDLQMPQVSGLELCQVVRQDARWGDLPVLVVTAHTDAESLQRAFAVGADDFITKPVLGPELVTRVLSRIERTRRRRQQPEDCR